MAKGERSEGWMRHSEIMGSLAALGFDCHNELSLSITHCIKKKKSPEQEHICTFLLKAEMHLAFLAPVFYFSGI